MKASFGHDTVGFCPGHPDHGSRVTHSDGFLADLESTLLHVEPGAQLTVTAPGHPGATVDMQWSIDSVPDSSSPVAATPVGDATWTLKAPGDAEEYILYIRLEWFEGEASYGVRVATRDLPPEGESLVAIEPSGNVAMHPTLVPYGYVDCGTTAEAVMLCDPEREQRWIEVATQEGFSQPEWAWSPADDRLPGVISMSEGWALHTGPDTFLVLATSGLDWEEMVAVARSIPAFDTSERAAECEATSAEHLPDTWWKCDLVIEMPDPTEPGLRNLVEVIGETPIGYSFGPALQGTSLTIRPILTYGPEGPWRELQQWKEQMVNSAEAVGADPAPLADGSYLIENFMLIYRPETPRNEFLDLLERLGENGYSTQMVLRERFGHR
ncbi:MAG: hypothetical protein QNJ81_15895 [Acidimicrobiia bacterium]|nr:hypothetical protein [Acidimicrobiia bacterium]